MLFCGWSKLVRAVMGFSFLPSPRQTWLWGDALLSYPFPLKSWLYSQGLAHTWVLLTLSPPAPAGERHGTARHGMARHRTAGTLGPAVKANMGSSTPASSAAPGFKFPVPTGNQSLEAPSVLCHGWVNGWAP